MSYKQAGEFFDKVSTLAAKRKPEDDALWNLSAGLSVLAEELGRDRETAQEIPKLLGQLLRRQG